MTTDVYDEFKKNIASNAGTLFRLIQTCMDNIVTLNQVIPFD